MITNHPQETSQAAKRAVYREQKKLSHRLDKISICEDRARKHTDAHQRRVEYELFGHPVRKSTGRYNKGYKEKRNRVLNNKPDEQGTNNRSTVKLPSIKNDVKRSRRPTHSGSPDITIFPNLSAAQSVDNILDERQVKYLPRNVDIKKERTHNVFPRFITEKQSDAENDGTVSQATETNVEMGATDKNVSRKRRLLKKYGQKWLRKTIRKAKVSNRKNSRIPGQNTSDTDEEPADLMNFISKMLDQYRTQKPNNNETDFLESKARKNKNIGGKYYASTAKLFASGHNAKGVGERKRATTEEGGGGDKRARGRRDDKHFRRMSVVMQNSAMFVKGLEWENTDEQTIL